MNASSFMDKQIMDLSRSSISDNTNPDFIDLINPQSEDQHHQVEFNHKKKNNQEQQEILPNYDFHPIHRPHVVVNNSTAPPASVGRNWGSVDGSVLADSFPPRSYGSLNHAEHEKIDLEKAQRVNESVILSEIERTMKTHTDTLMHAIDSLRARLSQIESRTRQLEDSVDDLKISVGNNSGSNDGKLRQLENILLEVKTGVQDLMDKQDVFEGQMQLAKLQLSKSEQSSEPPNTVNQNPVQQATASAPPQHSGFQQFPIPIQQPHSTMGPPNLPPPSQPSIHPPPQIPSQFPLPSTPAGPHHDTSSQQYQIPPPVQTQQQQPPPQASLPHQYQSGPTPPYPQPPQQNPSNMGPMGHHLDESSYAPQNTPNMGTMGHRPDESAYAPQNPPNMGPMGHRLDESAYAPPKTYPQPPQQNPSNMGHRPDESGYPPSQTYPSNMYHPTSQPSSGPPPMQTYYGSPSAMYEPPPPARSGSGFPSGPNEPFLYGGPTSHYGGGPPPVKPQVHSPRGGGGGGGGSYPQLPTARVLPQAIPTASGVGGGSSSGGSGNKVSVDDVVDKVTSMGFSRDQVRATVRRLTENGQAVDLNIVLDKLMNDSDVQPPKGWFSR